MTTLILSVGLGAWEMAYGADRALRVDADLDVTHVEVLLETNRAGSTKPVNGAAQVGD